MKWKVGLVNGTPVASRTPLPLCPIIASSARGCRPSGRRRWPGPRGICTAPLRREEQRPELHYTNTPSGQRGHQTAASNWSARSKHHLLFRKFTSCCAMMRKFGGLSIGPELVDTPGPLPDAIPVFPGDGDGVRNFNGRNQIASAASRRHVGNPSLMARMIFRATLVSLRQWRARACLLHRLIRGWRTPALLAASRIPNACGSVARVFDRGLRFVKV
jgi:hypothetical protein